MKVGRYDGAKERRRWDEELKQEKEGGRQGMGGRMRNRQTRVNSA